MPVNKSPFVKNLITGSTEPLRMLGKFQAGATQAVKRGELLELSGGNFIPLATDKAMSAVVAVADEEIKNGDKAGYYNILVPRPGDVFEFALSAAANPSVGANVAVSDSQTVTTTVTNQLGDVVGQEHYPDRQGHASDDASGDAGTTIRNTSNVLVTIKESTSYYAALQA